VSCLLDTTRLFFPSTLFPVCVLCRHLLSSTSLPPTLSWYPPRPYHQPLLVPTNVVTFYVPSSDHRLFTVYANILKHVYTTRFIGGSTRSGDSSEVQSTSNDDTPHFHLDTSRLDKYRKREKESNETSDKQHKTRDLDRELYRCVLVY